MRKVGRRRAGRVSPALAIALLAVACGGSGGDAATAAAEPETETTAPDPTVAGGATDEHTVGGPDPCALLEGVDPSVLLGEPAAEPRTDGTVCRVGPVDTASRGQLGLVIETQRPADNFETQKGVFGVDTEVSGLGDAAFHSGGYLFVLSDDTFFFLQVVRDASGSGVPDGDLEAAARTVIENLGG